MTRAGTCVWERVAARVAVGCRSSWRGGSRVGGGETVEVFDGKVEVFVVIGDGGEGSRAMLRAWTGGGE